MTAWRQGDGYLVRYDNPPELVEALSLWSFPPDFDPAQLPTGMFMCVIDEWRRIEREKKGLPPLPEKTCADVWQPPKTAELIKPEKSHMVRNSICLLGTIICGLGAGAYQTGHELTGIIALLVSVGIYAFIVVVKP